MILHTGHLLVFDSGVGGLSIVQHLRNALPEVRLTYLADSECFPYGTLSETHLVERVLGLLGEACERLHPDVIVLACNSASTLALPALRQQLQQPIVGVVPAVKPAAGISASKVIGLLATPGTVNRRYTDDLIARFAPDCEVLRLGSADLVEIVEQHLWGERQAGSRFEEVLSPWTADPRWPSVDTVVLACTHFPLVKAQLSAVAPTVRHWVDSGEAIARRTLHVLSETRVNSDRLPAADCALLTGPVPPSDALARVFNEFGFPQLKRF